MIEQELLAILDMDPDNQFWSIQKYLPKDLAELYDTSEISLADLAFKFRDEAIEKDLFWDDALVLVWEKLGRPKKYQTFHKYYVQPIHWIIAALIAKEKL